MHAWVVGSDSIECSKLLRCVGSCRRHRPPIALIRCNNACRLEPSCIKRGSQFNIVVPAFQRRFVPIADKINRQIVRCFCTLHPVNNVLNRQSNIVPRVSVCAAYPRRPGPLRKGLCMLIIKRWYRNDNQSLVSESESAYMVCRGAKDTYERTGNP